MGDRKTSGDRQEETGGQSKRRRERERERENGRQGEGNRER